jgi:hypothetical protein
MTDEDLAARVAALERRLDDIRNELQEQIVTAAHKLRDDSGFIGPFWRSGAEHMGEHVVTRAGRKVFLWLATGGAAALLMWAGSTRFWTA